MGQGRGEGELFTEGAGAGKGPRPSTTEAGPSPNDFGETKGAAAGKGAWPSTTQAAPPPCRGDDGKYHVIALKDGGGLPSTLDWQVPPPSAEGDPLQAVRQALWKALPQDSLAGMKSVMHSGTVAPFFQTIEVETLQRAICGALDIDPVWALQDFELTPYKFHLLSAVALRMGDIDVGLCDTLKVGAPTGVRERIPPSGVWPPLLQAEEGGGVEEGHPTMLCCDQNHASAEREPERVQRLVQQEIEAGYMVRVEGGLSALQQRFKENALAIGKLGVVEQAGKDDRLIGDSKASQASPSAKFSERTELPTLYHFGAALRRTGASHEDWCLFSIDVKGAHKSIRTAPEDVGFATFQLQGDYYIYLVNHFGAAWSAYWWARLSALLVRVSHHVLRHSQLGAVYVDDFLFLLPRAVAVPMATLLVAFFQAMRVPISWKKLQLGLELTLLGWDICLRSGYLVTLTDKKQEKLLGLINWFLLHPKKAPRQELLQLLGLLVWGTQARLALRPFLAPLFRAAHGRTSKLACVGMEQIEELIGLLGADRVMQGQVRLSDVQAGWRLVTVGARACTYANSALELLQQPKLKNGKLWLRFMAWGTTVLQWFHLELRREMIPKDWNWPESMQRGISSLELLAQLALLSMSVGLAGKQCSIQVCFRQRSDNMPTVGVVAKGLCTAYPLGAALQTLAYACLSYECDLDVAHIAGERNEKADKASRMLDLDNAPDEVSFNAVLRSNLAAGDMKEAEERLKQMVAMHLIPGRLQYNQLIEHFCKTGNVEKAYFLLTLMKALTSFDKTA
eukprot:symbB.v1.2.017546.t3/scaffold1371.1/size209032/18